MHSGTVGRNLFFTDSANNHSVPEPIELKFGMVDHVRHTTSHAKIDVRRFRGIGWG